MLVRKSTEGARERSVLIGMIVSTPVLGRIAAKWPKDGLMASQYANLIGGWCVKYYNRHGKAPGQHIEGIFAVWEEKSEDRDTSKMIQRLLEQLSGEYKSYRKGINPDHLMDQAAEHFDEVGRKKFLEKLQGYRDDGKLKEFDRAISTYKKVEIADQDGIDFFQDKATFLDVQDTSRDVLLKLPGAWGKFFRNAIEREGFLAFMGPEKRGKTFQMIELAVRAMFNKLRVAFFEVGDLSKRQIGRRLATRISLNPKEPGEYKIPTALEITQDGNKIVCVPDFETKVYKKVLSPDAAWNKAQKVLTRRMGDPNQSFFKLFVHPNDSISADGVRGICHDLARSGWPPDIVVIDYADILAAPAGFSGDSRDAINSGWKTMRRLSQELKCCVITGTQAKAASYAKDSVDMSDYAEDKRKFSHVTGMIGLNQSSDEKRDGIIRYNWLVLREDEFITTRYCYLAGNLALANPAMVTGMVG